MGKLYDLTTQLEGDALVDALANFDYQTDADVAAVADLQKGTSEWYQAADDRPLGGEDTFGELASLVAAGELDPDIYEAVLERRTGGDNANPADAGATVGAPGDQGASQ